MNGSLSVPSAGVETAPIRAAFVGTYPPTQCGLATFTASLMAAVATDARVDVGAIRMVEPGEVGGPVVGVVAEWRAGDPESRQEALNALDHFDAVILQHEFGIFGGPDGDEVLDFISRSPIPVVVVLHTVLVHPTAHQREVLERLIAEADVTVVQTESARLRLTGYLVERPENVVVIPHGAWTTATGHREMVLDRPIVLTWGLVGPGKGLEHGIRAIAELGDLDPLYVVAGETHPKVRAREGEAYRESLIRLANDMGISGSVLLSNTYRDGNALQALVRSADVVLLPYDSRDQVTSGVLVEALAAGRPVVATAFPHAIEALATGAGTVVAHGDPAAMASALRRVLADPEVAARMGGEARAHGALLAWSVIGRTYVGLLRTLVGARVAA